MIGTRKRIDKVISEITSTPESEVHRVNHVTELEKWDSLLLLNLMLGLEAEFKIHFDIEEITTVSTLTDMTVLVRNKLNA